MNCASKEELMSKVAYERDLDGIYVEDFGVLADGIYVALETSLNDAR